MPTATGTTACMGSPIKGRVFRADIQAPAQFRDGDILVHSMTTPDLVLLMRRAAAIVTFKGGKTCHAAIVSRELGVPCVVACPEAIQCSPGEIVEVDASEKVGVVRW